ncbi:MAG: flagellar biosynthesis protein FlhA [Nitrospirae bacterium]|nr:flagellar biosynthesis protein FlhA [Candidatus Manganitrophaceae bacterium]
MAETVSEQTPAGGWLKNGDIILSLGVVGVLMLMILPLPRMLLDLLLAFNLSVALIILFVSMYTLRPMEFSAFPSMLLLVTLFRLSLNIATTRLILLHGNEGADAAGEVIKTFGNFVVGGNYTVGLVVFAILIVINFVVITKGAGRIAEVAARFMLDAMPGKQMSIDADLNAGLIDEKEARRRRKAVSQEADFYGAMDGASKFVRGDAVAAILIVLVNIIGGLIIGVLQQGMGVMAAAQNYTLLTVGEGLVAQIPALIISTSAGIVVSRAAADANLGTEVTRQILVHPRAIMGAASIIFLFGLMPGLPHIAFLLLASAIGFMGYTAQKSKEAAAAAEIKETAPSAAPPAAEKQDWIVPLDLMELNVGYGLIPLVDEAQGGELLKRISAIRKQLALELGFVIPPIHIRDNLQIKPNEYIIMIKGIEVARGDLLPDHYLAMNPTGTDRGISGIPTKEPCFGLPALWVSEKEKERAQVAGYTVVDAPSVIATHLTEILRNHAHELLGRQEVQQLIDRFGKEAPKVVEELIPNLLPLGGVVKVLCNLLRERVPIRDLRTIMETLADTAPTTKDADLLTESVRQALGRTITRQYQAADRTLPVISIDPTLDQRIATSIQQSGQNYILTLDPMLAQKILLRIRQAVEQVSMKGTAPVLLCSPMIRPHLRKLVERFIPNLVVLSSSEVVSPVKIQSIETVKVSDAD